MAVNLAVYTLKLRPNLLMDTCCGELVTVPHLVAATSLRTSTAAPQPHADGPPRRLPHTQGQNAVRLLPSTAALRFPADHVRVSERLVFLDNSQ